jgi:hypothetical protein
MIMIAGASDLVSAVAGWVTLADRRLVPGRSVMDRVLGRCDVTEPSTGADALAHKPN